MSSINNAFKLVVKSSKLFNISESCGLKHSMQVFNYASLIYTDECKKSKVSKDYKEIIAVSAILHVMSDTIHINESIDINESIGIKHIKNHMSEFMSVSNLNVVTDIITSLSCSKVTKNDFTELGSYQLAYHIVRDADLLSAYDSFMHDIDRSIMYGMVVENKNYKDSVETSKKIFEDKILQYRNEKLFITDYSKILSFKLHNKAVQDMNNIYKNILL